MPEVKGATVVAEAADRTMTRLTIICHASTPAVRAARFPDDETIDDPSAIPAALAGSIAAGRWLTGPERRATATAAALAAGRDVRVDDDLREWDCGHWRGRDLAELHRREPDGVAAWLTDPSAAPHGGESLMDLLARIGRWLERQAAQGTRTAAVSHPAILRAAIVLALDAGPAAFRHIDAQPLTRAELSHDGRRWVLQGLAGPRHPA